MAKNLKSFIALLEEKHPEEIVRISKGPLRPHEGECHALLYHLERRSCWPMAIFEHVETLNRRRWEGTLQTQADGTFSKLALACGLPEEDWTAENLIQTLHERAQRQEKPVLVSDAEAPVKHHVRIGDECDFFDLPSYRKDAKDARPGWFSGVAIARELRTGRYNLSWHRLLLHGQRRSAARLQFRHLWDYLQGYKAAGHKEMPCVWVFGHHPLFMLASAVRAGYEVDEYDYASSLLGEPLRLTPSQTWGKDFLVPADAEVVVEGYLHCYETDVNGPWVDYMRYYSPQTLEPVFRPTAFLMAENPVFDAHIARHDLYHATSLALTLTQTLKRSYPRVKVAYMPAPYTAVVQFQPDHPGEATRVGMLALVAAGDFVKNVIIVDTDINPFDIHEVLFSVGTRVDANTHQVQKIGDLDANRHDPAPVEYLRVGGLIIDSTKPVDKPFPEIGYPDEALLERLKLTDYVPEEKVRRLLTGLFAQIHPTII